MKKSARRDLALAGAAAADERRPGGEEDRRPVGRRVGVGARAADRAPVADLRVADPARRVDEDRVAGADGRVLEDLAVGRPGADPQRRRRSRRCRRARRCRGCRRAAPAGRAAASAAAGGCSRPTGPSPRPPARTGSAARRGDRPVGRSRTEPGSSVLLCAPHGTLKLVAEAAGAFAGRRLKSIRPGRTKGFRHVRGARELSLRGRRPSIGLRPARVNAERCDRVARRPRRPVDDADPERRGRAASSGRRRSTARSRTSPPRRRSAGPPSASQSWRRTKPWISSSESNPRGRAVDRHQLGSRPRASRSSTSSAAPAGGPVPRRGSAARTGRPATTAGAP